MADLKQKLADLLKQKTYQPQTKTFMSGQLQRRMQMRMSDEPESQCQLRRRTIDGCSPLNLQVGYRVTEGMSLDRGTPSPVGVKFINDCDPKPSGSAMREFRKKQQSFDLQVEDCDEEEIIIDSEEETEAVSRPATPMNPPNLPDFGAGNVSYKEGPQSSDFLQVYAKDNECITDVSDAESDSDVNEEKSYQKGKCSKK